MTSAKLQKLCRTWQARLRLADWHVTIDFFEMENGVYGGVKPSPAFFEAEIGINKSLTTEKDIEETLVHELLHLRFPHHQVEFSPGHDPKTLMGFEFELGIDMISRALVEAYAS